MNILKTGLLMITIGVAPIALAREITPSEALSRLSSGQVSSKALSKAQRLSPELVHTARTVSGDAAAYVFSGNGDNGFIVLSADDMAIPLLGYSDSGNFSADNIPPQLEWWLSEYAAQIEYARKNNIQISDSKRPLSATGQREAIAPMLKTKWDQVAPYNDQCPLEGTVRTWTGCVATAIAQVMNYFQYPEVGKGQITYNIESLEKKVTLNFALKKFDWENMLDTYMDGNYTEEQAAAVAYLMKAAGYAVKMQYSSDASGALALNIRNGLVNYLDYDPNTLYTIRSYYSTEQWHDMIYENLKNVGPVVYGGGSTLGGGHSFVCDGYDGEGLYHFNWGWSGMSDGYFSLEALNPGSLGTGGGTGGGFNFTQDALLGLQPPTGQPVVEQPVFISQQGELIGTLTGTTLKLSVTDTSNPAWVSYNPRTLNFKFGVMFEPQGDTPGGKIYKELPTSVATLEPGYGVFINNNASVNLSTVGLSDGTYKMVVGSTVVDRTQTGPTDGSEWVPVKTNYGCSNYVTIKVENGKYSITNHILPKLKITGEFTSPLYYGCLVKVKVSVENTADIDRVSGFAPMIADDQGILMLGESIFVNIPAHSTVTREWTTDLTQFVQYFDSYINVPLVFSFFDEENYRFLLDEFQTPVTVLPTPSVPRVIVSNFAIEGATLEKDIYTIPDPENIHITADLGIARGYFGYTVVACLCEPYDNSQVAILETAANPVFLTSENKSVTFDGTICYPAVKAGNIYYITLAYSAPGGLAQISDLIPVKFSGKSGVTDIDEESGISFVTDKATRTVTVTSANGIASVEAYDISGRRMDQDITLDGNIATIHLNNSGIVIVTVRDNASNQKAFKVTL